MYISLTKKLKKYIITYDNMLLESGEIMKRYQYSGKHGTEMIKKKKLRIDRVIITLIIMILFILAVSKIVKSVDGKIQNVKESLNSGELSQDYQIEYIPDTNLSIAVIGDIMCHNTQYMDAANGNGYDFSYVFDDIKDKIESADLAIGNLETTFAGSKVGYSSYPTFNTPEHLATDLKELGIDVLSTVNNHCLDKGYTGIEGTINELDEAGIVHTGTYTSEEAANEITYIEVNGMKIAVLAYTYGTNGMPIPKGKDYCVNLINKDKIVSDLEKAKEGNPDLIITIMHWGTEYQKSPNSEQQELADLLFQNGTDIILGGHPHVLQRMEKREVTLEDGTKKDGFVIYSLGNFVSGQYQAGTRQSIILHINLTKSGKNGAISIDNVDYTPIYTFKGNHYRILDMEKTINNYNNGDTTYSSGTISTLKTELEQVINRMGDRIE